MGISLHKLMVREPAAVAVRTLVLVLILLTSPPRTRLKVAPSIDLGGGGDKHATREQEERAHEREIS